MKNMWGKIMGGFLGFATGGPVGSFLGIVVGHMYDTHPEMADSLRNLRDGQTGFSGNSQQLTFTIGIIALGAKMAKVDGRVTRAEIDAFKRVFQIAPEQAAQVGRIFDKAKESADGFEPYAFQLAQTFRYQHSVLEEILGGLFIIAAADSAGLSPAELRFLRRIAVIFSIDDKDDFARIAARAGIYMPRTEKPRKETDEAYAILGVQEDADPEAIKIAYRTLIRKYHPDKLMSQGMPPEFVATANEKMKRINVAYDTICKIRSIR